MRKVLIRNDKEFIQQEQRRQSSVVKKSESSPLSITRNVNE